MSNPRANAIRRLEKLRMKRKGESSDQNGLICATRRPRSCQIPIPPTPPPREVNASKLEFLFEKRLKYSDVKSEGRIVVPKALAEKYMPRLKSKEGVYIFMDDMVAVKFWMFRYRFWLNNSSRVYVVENTGEFRKAHGLRVGDFIMVYKDNESQRYAIGARKSDDGEVPPTAADLLPTSKDNTIVSTSDHQGLTSSQASAACSDYSNSTDDALQGFPMDLLITVDISDLPEY